MGFKCKVCKKNVPLHRMVFSKKISCKNCGTIYLADDAFSARLGIWGIALGSISVLGDIGFYFAIFAACGVLAYLKFSNVLEKYIKPESKPD